MNAELEMSFRALGLTPGASWDDVKSAFRRLALVCHPDVAGPSSAARFQEITQAYMVLKSASVLDLDGQAPAARAGAGSPSEERDVSSGASSFFSKTFGRWWLWWRSRQRRRDEAQTESRRRAWEESEMRRRRHIRVSGIIEEAERRFLGVLERGAGGVQGDVVELHLERLRSGHPVVRCMALDALLNQLDRPEVGTGLALALAEGVFSGESLRRLLGSRLSREVAELFSDAVRPRAAAMEEGDALFLLKWLRGMSGLGCDTLGVLLAHPAPSVVGDALLQWPRASLPEDGAVQRLLHRDEDRILVPLLRLLKGRPQSSAVLELLRRKSEQHCSPAVRAWARALVSEAEAR